MVARTAATASPRPSQSAEALIWSLIAAMGVADYVLFAAQGMTIAIHWPVILYITALYAASLGIQRRNPPGARLLSAFAQVFAFGQVGGYLSYAAMAASPFPMADAVLARADAALGFDWVAWFTWLNAHPTLQFVLTKAYASIPLQVLVLLVFFAFADTKRIDELLLAAILSVAMIVPIMVLLPAVGAWSQHGVGVEPWRADILALRAHSLLKVGATQGIISFPSFHTVLGVLLANMARGRKWFAPVLVLNLMLIAAVMSAGAHYGVDMLSGLVVSWLGIATARAMLKWCAHADATITLPQLVSETS
jgi:PAP2 superfamily